MFAVIKDLIKRPSKSADDDARSHPKLALLVKELNAQGITTEHSGDLKYEDVFFVDLPKEVAVNLPEQGPLDWSLVYQHEDSCKAFYEGQDTMLSLTEKDIRRYLSKSVGKGDAPLAFDSKVMLERSERSKLVEKGRCRLIKKGNSPTKKEAKEVAAWVVKNGLQS
jgi:hypothetical protein